MSVCPHCGCDATELDAAVARVKAIEIKAQADLDIIQGIRHNAETLAYASLYHTHEKG